MHVDDPYFNLRHLIIISSKLMKLSLKLTCKRYWLSRNCQQQIQCQLMMMMMKLFKQLRFQIRPHILWGLIWIPRCLTYMNQIHAKPRTLQRHFQTDLKDDHFLACKVSSVDVLNLATAVSVNQMLWRFLCLIMSKHSELAVHFPVF